MKRLLTAGVMAALLLIGSVQKTHAWSKCNFGAGVNWRWEGGGNNFMWGLAKGANVPDPSMMGGYGAPADGTGDHGYGMAPAMPPAMSPAPEKVAPPAPLRPASYYAEQQPAAAYQQPPAQEAPAYAYPSYWYEQR